MARKNKQTEYELQKMVCEYVRLQYPEAIFMSSLNGIKLTIGQAKKAMALQSKDKYPDFFLAMPRGVYHGLFIEFKKSREEIYCKNGEIRKSKHLESQCNTLNKLSLIGYCTAIEYDFYSAKNTIDRYMCR